MIQLHHLHFGYNRKKALFTDLSLELEPGNIYGLLGQNGAGKTTLLKTLLALFLLGVFIAIFTSLLTKLIMAGHWPEQGGFEPEYFQQVPAFFTVTLPAIAKTFFWYLMGPFFLIVSYFKLKERQV